jgi:hypothetical protein
MRRIENQPKRPFYISKSDVVNIEWAQNFAQNLPNVTGQYNLPAALEDKVIANALMLSRLLQFETIISDWLKEWRVCKASLFNGFPLNNDPVPVPNTPVFPDKPVPVAAYVLAPFIQAANIILANPAVTEADKNLLGLVKAEGKPVTPETQRREAAESFNYPVMKASVVNGTVVIKFIRGNRFKGESVLLQVDREGMGNFTNLLVTTAREFNELAQLPPGRVSAAWTYKAVYVKSETLISDWSPNLTLAITQGEFPFSPPPVVSPAANLQSSGDSNGNGMQAV